MKPFKQILVAALSAIVLSTGGAMAQAQDSDKIYGKVIETIDTANYTYIHVDTGKEEIWAAAPPIKLDKGAMVSFGSGMPMPNFTSNSLDRTFDMIYFVGTVTTDQADPQATGAGAHGGAMAAAPEADASKITKAANGITINEALANRSSLAGQTVLIRGLVGKFTAKVMGKNWVHIRDASTDKDLTVTTEDTVGIGDVVLVSGTLVTDKDFGYGYTYEVMIEDSTVKVE